MIVTTVNAVLQRVPPRDAIARRQLRREKWGGGGPRGAGRIPGRQWLCSGRHGARTRRFRPARRHRRSMAARRGTAAAAGFFRLYAGCDPQIRCRDPTVRKTAVARDRASARQRSAAQCRKPSAASAPAMSRPSARRATIRFMKASVPDARPKAWSTGCRCSMSGLDTLFDYLPRALVLLGHQVEEAKNGAAGTDRRLLRHPRAIPPAKDRKASPSRRPPYKPLKPDALVSDRCRLEGRAGKEHLVRELTPFQAPE